MLRVCFLFFKQKTAYEMRIGDWSSDVCSSDLTKMRSVVNLGNPAGIKAIVQQQFAEAKRIAAHGLVPIIEPEVNIKSPERDSADRLLLKECLAALDAWDGAPVMLKLSLPTEAGLFQPRSEEHTSELQSLMRTSYAVFCLKKKKTQE